MRLTDVAAHTDLVAYWKFNDAGEDFRRCGAWCEKGWGVIGRGAEEQGNSQP